MGEIAKPRTYKTAFIILFVKGVKHYIRLDLGYAIDQTWLYSVKFMLEAKVNFLLALGENAYANAQWDA